MIEREARECLFSCSIIILTRIITQTRTPTQVLTGRLCILAMAKQKLDFVRRKLEKFSNTNTLKHQHTQTPTHSNTNTGTRSSNVDILLFLVHVVRVVDWYEEKSGKEKERDEKEKEEEKESIRERDTE
jgi:hypothetical protein